MSDKTKVQADGSGEQEAGGALQGHEGAGESGGGAYPNPHRGKAPQDGPLGHGGQTEITQKPPGQQS